MPIHAEGSGDVAAPSRFSIEKSDAAYNLVMNSLTEQHVVRPADSFEFAEYGIVFGCDFESEMKMRIEGAIGLIQKDRVGALILSGGYTGATDRSEAEVMKSTAVESGIAPDRLILEDQSRTTQQNMLRCGDLLVARHGNVNGLSVVLITSDWPMSRAWMMAKRYLPDSIRVLCAPQRTTCNVDDWSETIQCACLVRSELARVRHAMQKGFLDPRAIQAKD